MIACPHCDNYVKPSTDGADFDCPMCGERVARSAGSSKKLIALGVGVAVAAAAAAYVFAAEEEPAPKFQPAYGHGPVENVTF